MVDRTRLSTSKESQWLQVILLFYLLAIGQSGLVVTKPGSSDQECESACLSTTELDCHFYKFSKSKSTCYLTVSPDPALTNMKKVNKPAPAPDKKPASSWLSELQARILALEQKDNDVKKLHRDITELKTELASVKNSRALTHHLLRTSKEQQNQNLAAVDDKVETLKSESHRVEDAVMTLGELQKTLGERLKRIGDAQRASGLTVAMLSQANKDMRSSVRELAITSAEAKTSLTDLRKTITELEVRFAGLSTDVMEKVANVDTMLGPELKEIRGSQTNLAQALSLLTKKMMLLSPRLPFIQRRLGVNQGKMSAMERKMKDFRKEIAFMGDRVGLSEQQLKKFVDPASAINQERRRLITQLRAEVATLQDSQRRVQNDVLVEISDRTRLYKELADLKVSRKMLVDKVVTLEEAVRNFRRDLRHLAIEGPRGKVVSHILTRQVAALRSLKTLRQTQVDVRRALQQYRWEMLRTHKDLASRDKQHMMDEVALRKLQEKLLTIYRQLRNLPHGETEPHLVTQLAHKQNQTLLRMGQMMKLQAALQQDVSAYKQSILRAGRKLEEERMAQRKSVAELEELRRKTNVLYAAVRRRLFKGDGDQRSKSLQRLEALDHTQRSVVQALADYKSALAHTQLELSAQKRAQERAADTTHALHDQLRTLRRQLATVTGHSDYSDTSDEDLGTLQSLDEVHKMKDNHRRLETFGRGVQPVETLAHPEEAGLSSNYRNRKWVQDIERKRLRDLRRMVHDLKVRSRRGQLDRAAARRLRNDMKRIHKALSNADNEARSVPNPESILRQEQQLRPNQNLREAIERTAALEN
ncbi:coiled-coil domain-containing protein 18 [Aplysia californica]|uniref:Coiled-coil domain-containing protein 18 n=1 Tax=Aplysia californica TaxID=6500 RepID=A0ABM1A3S5_APLCA|nr:coiled-coil domain-containing protein 18 [Aplysia californica]